MIERTRQVLSLLADPLSQQLLAACREESRTRRALEKATGAAQATLKERLALLEAHGLLDRTLDRHGARGRPADAWTSRADEELHRLEQVADAVVLEILEGMVSKQQDAIRARTRHEVTAAEQEGIEGGDRS